MKKTGWILAGIWFGFLLAIPVHAQSKKAAGWNWNSPDSLVWFSASAEAGFLAIVNHTVQFGKGSTNFDYVANGGQDNLFFFWRLSADVTLNKRHTLTFLYQPLDLRTQTVLGAELKQDMATFPKGDALNLRYGFDFYRLSYTYDLFPEKERELSFGVTLQLRNATIVFSNVSGTRRSYRNDVGPVPLLKARGYFPVANRFWFGFEVDGFYAPIRFLNGGTTDVEGAFVDASVRIGYRLMKTLDLFLNIRYLGGGGQGTSGSTTEPGADGYVANWIHGLSISLGAAIR